MGAVEDRYSGAMSEKPCAICKRPIQPGYAPFCSKRCADVDLQRWLAGVYAVPGRDADEEADSDLERPSGRPGQSEGGPL